MTFNTREKPSVAPKLGTTVNENKGSVREACEETALLKLKIYNTNIIEAVRTFIIILLVFFECRKLILFQS